MAENGKRSSGKKTRHIEIRYYFITDQIALNNASIRYCPTEQMIADFFTKPLQGALFRRLRSLIMNNVIYETVSTDGQECVGDSSTNECQFPNITSPNHVDVEGKDPIQDTPQHDVRETPMITAVP